MKVDLSEKLHKQTSYGHIHTHCTHTHAYIHKLHKHSLHTYTLGVMDKHKLNLKADASAHTLTHTQSNQIKLSFIRAGEGPTS